LKRELLWVIAGTLLTMVGGLLTIKLLSNMLSIEAFGRYALLFSVVTFLVAVLYTPLGQVNLRFAIIAQKDSALLGYLALQRRIFIVISGLSLLSLAGAGFWFGQSGFWAMLALTLAMGVQVTQQYLLMAFRKRRENGIAQLVGAVTRPAAVFLAIYLAGSDEVNGWRWGFSR
jgi:O-antigen/teichoic acid export membrane protein